MNSEPNVTTEEQTASTKEHHQPPGETAHAEPQVDEQAEPTRLIDEAGDANEPADSEPPHVETKAADVKPQAEVESTVEEPVMDAPTSAPEANAEAAEPNREEAAEETTAKVSEAQSVPDAASVAEKAVGVGKEAVQVAENRVEEVAEAVQSVAEGVVETAQTTVSDVVDTAQSVVEGVAHAVDNVGREVTEPTPSENDPPTASSESTSVGTPSEESKAEESKDVPPEQASASEKPKVRLNPTVDANKAKAIPSLNAEGQPVAEQGADQPQAPVSATDVGSLEPVEIPKADELDEAMQAELAAAMNQHLPTPTAVPSSGGETENAGEVVTELSSGDRVKAVVQSVHGDDIILDLGVRSSGIMSTKQFPADKLPKAGDKLDVVIDKISEEEGTITVTRPTAARKVSGNWDNLEAGQVIECMVTKSNKGGLEISAQGIRGFLPASQVDLMFVSNLEPFIGQKLRVKTIDVNPEKRNLVVSRRALLEEERKEQEAEIWKGIEVGQERTGRVKTVKDYGAFVDIGGVDGLLHVGEMSWQRIRHPSDIISEGDEVTVKIINVDPEKKKIGLGMKQLLSNPWEQAETKFAKGTNVQGKVTKTTDFGAFVELEEHVEGLIHISELDHKRVARVTDVVNVGQEVEVQVLEVNKNRKRISLSLKALKDKPKVEEPVPVPEMEAPEQDRAPRRKRKGPLKGGMGRKSDRDQGSSGGGGLFGNPKDFGT